MVHAPLASVLRSGRDVFNAKFAEARRRYPDLDAGVLQDFLRTTLDPLAASCPADQLGPVILAAYEVALDLAGEGLAGNDPRGLGIKDAWRRIVPAHWALARTEPHRLFASLSNAIHNLAAARPDQLDAWIADLARLAGQCPDRDTLLAVGQVRAWRAGLAHYRTGALAVADCLPPALALAALGAPSGTDWDKLRATLAVDPWHDPTQPPAPGAATLRVAARVGAFRGLGGRFAVPPVVTAADGQLYVQSRDRSWLLLADCFGHSLHAVTAGEFDRARAEPPPVGAKVTAEKITADGAALANPAGAAMTSCAILRDTIALTTSLSHAVILVARQPRS